MQQCEEKGDTDTGEKSSLEIKLLITVNSRGAQWLCTAMRPLVLMGTKGSERQRGWLVAWGLEGPPKIKKHTAQRCYTQ